MPVLRLSHPRILRACSAQSNASFLVNQAIFKTTRIWASTLPARLHHQTYFPTMGKKKVKDYNDFLDGEKLRDNTNVRTSLQASSTLHRDTSPPQIRQDRKNRPQTNTKAAPKRPQLTHFLCLPLVNEASRPQFQLALDKLREELTSSDLVSLRAIRPLGTLHLTLGVMSLNSPQLERAQQYLEQLDLEQLLRGITASFSAEKAAEPASVQEKLGATAQSNPNHIRINLEALVPMQKPTQTSILYAHPDDASGRLQAFGQTLKNRFQQESLMVEDKRDLKLHATVINTIYAKPKGKDARKSAGSGSKQNLLDGQDGHGPNAKSWMRFDATSLIERYGDFVWAEDVVIDRVQICKMGAAKIMNEAGEIVDEKYEVVAEKLI